MDNLTLFIILFPMNMFVSALYGVFTYFVYREYIYIKKEVSKDVPDSVLYMLYYAFFLVLTVFLANIAANAPGYDRFSLIIVQLLTPISVIGLIFLALAIKEFAKSFPGKNIKKYSKILVYSLIIVFISASISTTIYIVRGSVPYIVGAIVMYISVAAIVIAPIMMTKLRSHSKGSILAKSLKFLTIGFVFSALFGTMSFLTIGYNVEEDDSVEEYSNFPQLFLFFNHTMAFIGFYLIYRAIREISGYFKGFSSTPIKAGSERTE